MLNLMHKNTMNGDLREPVSGAGRAGRRLLTGHGVVIILRRFVSHGHDL